jgi:hypothetical protein
MSAQRVTMLRLYQPSRKRTLIITLNFNRDSKDLARLRRSLWGLLFHYTLPSIAVRQITFLSLRAMMLPLISRLLPVRRSTGDIKTLFSSSNGSQMTFVTSTNAPKAVSWSLRVFGRVRHLLTKSRGFLCHFCPKQENIEPTPKCRTEYSGLKFHSPNSTSYGVPHIKLHILLFNVSTTLLPSHSSHTAYHKPEKANTMQTISFFGVWS